MNHASHRPLALAFTLLFVVSPLLAEDPAAAHGESESKLISFIPSTMIWTILIFVVVLGALYKLAWGPLLKALDEREGKIRESLEAADRMREEQLKFQAEQEVVLAAARKEANELVAEGKRDAEAVKEKIVHDARMQSEDLKQRALAEIDRAKDLAVGEIHLRAVDLSIAIAEKLVGHAVTTEDQERLVQDTIEQYEKIKN